MYCSKCGKEIAEEMTFCQYCGNPVNASGDTTEPIKNTTGSFLRSLQEKAKSVNASINTAAKEAQKKAEEKSAQSEKSNLNTYGKQTEKTRQSMVIQSERFKIKRFSNGVFDIHGSVIVDRLTGVNYLFAGIGTGDAHGLTVLVDENGKPLVTKEDKIEINNTEENKMEQDKENNVE